jgi:hypothetical protein
MNEELQKKLNELGLSLIESIQSGASWIGQQTRPFVEELIRYHIIVSSFYLALFLILAAIAFYAANKFKKNGKTAFEKWKNEDKETRRYCFDSSGYEFGHFVSLTVGGVFAISGCTANIPDIIKATCAPRVFVVEQLRESLSGK